MMDKTPKHKKRQRQAFWFCVVALLTFILAAAAVEFIILKELSLE